MEDVELPVGDTLLHSKVVHYINQKDEDNCSSGIASSFSLLPRRP